MELGAIAASWMVVALCLLFGIPRLIRLGWYLTLRDDDYRRSEVVVGGTGIVLASVVITDQVLAWRMQTPEWQVDATLAIMVGFLITAVWRSPRQREARHLRRRRSDESRASRLK